MKNLRQRIFLSIIGLLASAAMMAQFTVSGIVYDGDKEPAIGATVVEKGKASNGTVTDMEGRYNLKVSSSKAVLVVTYIGFDPQEVAVNGKGKVNVFLQETPTNLDEVVIVGFATQKKILTAVLTFPTSRKWKTWQHF